MSNNACERSEANQNTLLRQAFSNVKNVAKVLTILGAMTLPLVVATPAAAEAVSKNAATSTAAAAGSACNLSVAEPEYTKAAWLSPAKVTYRVTIKCPLYVPVYVQVQQRPFEGIDDPGVAIAPTKTDFQFMPIGGSHTFTRTFAPPTGTEPGNEEFYQKARFLQVGSLPIPAGTQYGPWVTSSYTSVPV